MVERIISGGQTGADYGGLLAAEALGLKTGGTAPKGFRTELGSNPELGSRFGLKESPEYTYPPRTRENVRLSGGTVIFGFTTEAGSGLTMKICAHQGKPCFLVDSFDSEEREEKITLFRQWIKANCIKVLNVAGNRASRNKGIEQKVKEFLVEALSV